MKRIVRLVLLIALLICIAPAAPARALTPYTTWAMGPGWYLYLTQDAYVPVGETDLPISGAEDMFVTST